MAAHGKASETKEFVELTRMCRNVQSEARLTGRAKRPLKGYQHEWKYGQGRWIANEAAGKIKQGVGKAVGSDILQRKVAGREAKGDAQQLKGDAKNSIKDGINKVAGAANKKL